MRAGVVALVIALAACATPRHDPIEPPAENPIPVIVDGPGAIPGVTGLGIVPVPDDDGRHLAIAFFRPGLHRAPDSGFVAVIARRALDVVTSDERSLALAIPAGAKPAAKQHFGVWTIAAVLEGPGAFVDEVPVPSVSYEYAVFEVRLDADGNAVARSAEMRDLDVAPAAAWFHTKRWGFLLIVAAIAGLIFFYVRKARRDPASIYVRRIPGVDAIEDAVGRSTEMGRPVLYVTGLDQIQDIQTLASLLILGHVSKLTATYDTEIKVANYYPLTMVVAEEIVRQGYANAGRLDAHRPENVLFISAEQFAFAAGVNGLILRDRPATNIYFGKFFGESLLLAETGFLTGAVQIAGTAELTQLPFFVAACDYTLIGEEMYATSAYLSGEPTLLANLKAGDAVKAAAMLFIIVGALLATLGWYDLGPKVFP
jgi:hypothetical protein